MFQPSAPVLPEQFTSPGADTTPLNDYWRHGLRFESADKAFSIFIGGRFQFDTVDYLTSTGMRQNIPGNVPLEDGVSFRRFRFDMGGTLYKNIEYYAQVDFFNGFVTDIAENRLSNVARPDRPVVAVHGPPADRQHPRRQPEAALLFRAPHEQPVPELPGTVARVRCVRGELRQWVRARHHACEIPF